MPRRFGCVMSSHASSRAGAQSSELESGRRLNGTSFFSPDRDPRGDAAQSSGTTTQRPRERSNTWNGVGAGRLRPAVVKWTKEEKELTWLSVNAFMRQLRITDRRELRGGAHGRNFWQRFMEIWEIERMEKSLPIRTQAAIEKVINEYERERVRAEAGIPNVTPVVNEVCAGNNRIDFETDESESSVVEELEQETWECEPRVPQDVPDEIIRVVEPNRVRRSVTAVRQRSDGNGMKPAEPPSENPLLTQLRVRFHKIFRRVAMLPVTSRKPLKLERISPELWSIANLISAEMINHKTGLARLNKIVYAIGVTIKQASSETANELVHDKNCWVDTVKKEQAQLRRYIGWIENELSRRSGAHRPTEKQGRNFEALRRRYRIDGRPIRQTNDLVMQSDRLKTRLKLLQAKVDLHETGIKRERLLKTKERWLLRPSAATNNAIDVEKVREYWQEIVGTPKPYTRSEELNKWMHELGRLARPLKVNVGVGEGRLKWRKVLAKARPHKAPGPDGIPNVLWKKLGSAQSRLFEWLVDGGKVRQGYPSWLAKGRIILLPKSGDLTQPENLRPIACLNTQYKLITGFLSQLIYEHCQAILPNNQIALRKGLWSSTHASILDRSMNAESLSEGRSHNVAWVDYAKAFDSIPHSYIRKLLTVLKLPKEVKNAISNLISKWAVTYEVKASGRLMESKLMRVRSGVLQGDTLSPLLFCLAVAPISLMLNSMQDPIEKTFKPNHLLYMDDLKIYSHEKGKLMEMVSATKELSSNIGLAMNERKCAIAGTDCVQPEDGKMWLPFLDEASTYKYLGIEQRLLACHEECWKRVEKETLKRLMAALDARMTYGQIRRVFNSMAVPVSRYLFTNLVHAEKRYIHIRNRARDLDSQVRNLLSEQKLRPQKSNAARLYLPVKMGGCGWLSLEQTLKESVVYCWCYLACTETEWFGFARSVLYSLKDSSSVCGAAKQILTEANVHATAGNGIISLRIDQGVSTIYTPREAARRITKDLRVGFAQECLKSWRSAKMAGRVSRAGIDQELSFRWLAVAHVDKRVIRNVIGIQEGCLVSWAKRNCLRCGHASETEMHIVSACNWSKTGLMLDRHNGPCRVLYNELCRKYQLVVPHHQTPVPSLTESNKVKILYDCLLETGSMSKARGDDEKCKPLKCRRPDLVVFDKIQRRIIVVEVGVPWFGRLDDMFYIKYHKYATDGTVEDEMELLNMRDSAARPNLKHELGVMYGKDFPAGVSVVPVIIGTCGEVKSNVIEQIKSIGFVKLGEAESILVRMQIATIQGTSRLVKAHTSNAK